MSIHAYLHVPSFLQVGTNGIFSFARRFYFHSPEPFPGASSSSYLVAPFWSDNDISNGVGQVSYEIHPYRTEAVIWTSKFITEQRQTDFSGSWMLVAEWKNVPEFGSTTTSVSHS